MTASACVCDSVTVVTASARVCRPRPGGQPCQPRPGAGEAGTRGLRLRAAAAGRPSAKTGGNAPPAPARSVGPWGMGWSRPHCEGGPLLSAHPCQSLLHRHTQKFCFYQHWRLLSSGRLTHKLMTTVRMVHFP